MNLSQKYALEQCLSHKSYNKKEVRMAVRGGGGHNIKKHAFLIRLMSEIGY